MGEQADDAKVINFAKEEDPFDPESLRISIDGSDIGTEKVLLAVPVRKPGKAEFFRVHPDSAYRLDMMLLKFEDERFIVSKGLLPGLATEVEPVTLFTCISRVNVLFLWPVRLPGSDGRDNPYWETAREIADRAMTSWVRCVANQDLRAYEMTLALGNLPEPTWPALPMRDLLELAFKGRVIRDGQHHIIKRLAGEL
jgi:hypothetical protein